jgi:hypothetical protein
MTKKKASTPSLRGSTAEIFSLAALLFASMHPEKRAHARRYHAMAMKISSASSHYSAMTKLFSLRAHLSGSAAK